MKIEIRKGNLYVEVNGVMSEKLCPFASRHNGITMNRCGEWCAHFNIVEFALCYDEETDKNVSKKIDPYIEICHFKKLHGNIRRIE